MNSIIALCPQGKLTAQGKLLQQDTFTLIEQETGVLPRPKLRQVFLFEQLIILSEPIDRKKDFSLPGYIYKNSIKVVMRSFRLKTLHFIPLRVRNLFRGQLERCGVKCSVVESK